MSDEVIEPFTLRKRDECLFCGVSYKEFISQAEKIKELQEAVEAAKAIIIPSEYRKWVEKYVLEKEGE